MHIPWALVAINIKVSRALAPAESWIHGIQTMYETTALMPKTSCRAGCGSYCSRQSGLPVYFVVYPGLPGYTVTHITLAFKENLVEILQQALKKLANSMRIYVETHIDFQRLIAIDKEEAIDNLDRAFEAKLEAFHSLYDVSKNYLDYFSNADTASLILMRNAIHHRDHLIFNSWNQEMALNEKYKKYLGAEFLFVDYHVSDSPFKMRYFYKIEDFYLRTDQKMMSPYLENKMGAANREKLISQMELGLKFLDIQQYAKSEKYPLNQVYINVMPIFISAACRVFKVLKENGVKFVGFDAQTYEQPFTSELEVDFSKLTYETLRIT